MKKKRGMGNIRIPFSSGKFSLKPCHESWCKFGWFVWDRNGICQLHLNWKSDLYLWSLFSHCRQICVFTLSIMELHSRGGMVVQLYDFNGSQWKMMKSFLIAEWHKRALERICMKSFKEILSKSQNCRKFRSKLHVIPCNFTLHSDADTQSRC